MATATGVYNTTYRKDFALRHTKGEYARLALLGAAVVVLPFTLDQYWLSYLNLILLAAIAAVGLNILTGYTGLVSLATAGFLGVGAYTTANLTVRLHWPMPVGVVAGTLMAAAIGALFGLPALRLKGLYLAITTFAAQYILSNRFRDWAWLTQGHGNISMSSPKIGGHVIRSRHQPLPDGPRAGLHRHPRPGHRRRGHGRPPRPLQGAGLFHRLRAGRPVGGAPGPLPGRGHVGKL